MLAFIIFYISKSQAQVNLVRNGSFEEVDSCYFNCTICPYAGTDQMIRNAIGFYSFPSNIIGNSPDLFYTSSCWPFSTLSIPSIYGYQLPRTGNFFSGLIQMWDTNQVSNGYSEYLSANLISSLIAGRHYCLNFYVSPADNFQIICNNIGACFTEDTLNDSFIADFGNNILNIPNVAENNPNLQPFIDMNQWYKISTSFISNGNETVLTIGNFSKYDSLDLIYNPGTLYTNRSYLYIDDVSLYELKALHSRDTLICPGSSFPISIKAYPSFDSYVWSNGDTNRITQFTQPGTYWVTASNWCGSTTDSITIAYAEPQNFQVQWLDMALCPEQFPYYLYAPAQAYSSYQWSLNNTLISDTSLVILPNAGTLVFNAQWACGKVTDTVQISQNISPLLNLGNDTLICLSNSFVVQAPAGYQYQWSNGSSQQNLTVIQSGLYALQITDSLGCTAKDTLQVNIYPPQNYALNLGNDQWVCTDDFPFLVQCTNANFNSYQWSTGVTDSLFITVPSAGVFWLQATYICGSKTDTIAIKNAPSANLNLGPDTTLCIGQELALTAPDSMQYFWSNGSIDKTIVVDTTANLSLMVVNQYGCSNTDQIQIIYEPAYHQFLPDDTTLFAGSTLSIDIPNNLNNVLWNDGSIEMQRIIVEAGLYVVQASDENKCLLSDSVSVNFVAINPQLPGLITAGDYFIIRNLPQGAQLMVYDALGQIVYLNVEYINNWQPELSNAVYFVSLFLQSGEELRGKVLVME